MDTYLLFKQIITGDFDNGKQIELEKNNGNQIHPFAKHVNRVFDEKITGLPQNNGADNFWVLEESYYTYPNKPTEVKPYLFNFSRYEQNKIKLTVYQIPKEWKKEDCRNDNSEFKLKYEELVPSSTFKGAIYTYNEKEKAFETNSVNELGNGMTFTLTETLSLKQLIVMELLQKEGKRITPYNTPIIYDRK